MPERGCTSVVSHAPRAFRADRPLPVNLWTAPADAGGLLFRQVLPPGQQREQAARQIREHFTVLADGAKDAVTELRALIAAHEPVQLINSVAVPTSMRLFAKGDGVADEPDTVTWPAKVEYLVGVAISMPPGQGDTPSTVTERVMTLVSDVFDAVHAQTMLASFDSPSSGHDAVDQVLLMLRMEHLTDRMPGYAVHLERIDAEVFDRHSGFYVTALGFNPGDVVRVVRGTTAAVQARMSKAMQNIGRAGRRDSAASAAAVVEMLKALTDMRTWQPETVAADTGVDEEQIRRMLQFFATTFGSQPEFRLPTDRNLARSHPAIDIGEAGYFVPDPWSLAAAVHDRMRELAGDSQGLLQRYHRHREDGHQRLVAGALRKVFPSELVRESQHYDSEADGPGEIDVLVALEWPLIVEAKAHGLTDSGRRGAPGRVRRVTADVIEKALDQTRRAKGYIIGEGGRAFAPSQGGRAVNVLGTAVAMTTEIIATFERFDPLAMAGPALVRQDGRAVWTVNIADLLMVSDILDEPASFHHYARTRASLVADGIQVNMESDALGTYLIDRCVALRAQAAADDAAVVMLGYQSEAINAYFTSAELGLAARKPSVDVPKPVTASLARALEQRAAQWTRAVDAVLGADADVWRRFRSYSKRHRGGGRFPLDPAVRLVVTDARAIQTAMVSTDDGLIELHVASRAPSTRQGPH